MLFRSPLFHPHPPRQIQPFPKSHRKYSLISLEPSIELGHSKPIILIITNVFIHLGCYTVTCWGHSWKPDLLSLIIVTDVYRLISLCCVGLSALDGFSEVCLRAQSPGHQSSHPEPWVNLLCGLQQVLVFLIASVIHLMNGPQIPSPTRD